MKLKTIVNILSESEKFCKDCKYFNKGYCNLHKAKYNKYDVCGNWIKK